jgi:hypothetical protein
VDGVDLVDLVDNLDCFAHARTDGAAFSFGKTGLRFAENA